MKNFEKTGIRFRDLGNGRMVVCGKFGHIWFIDRKNNKEELIMELFRSPSKWLEMIKWKNNILQKVVDRECVDEVVSFVWGLMKEWQGERVYGAKN